MALLEVGIKGGKALKGIKGESWVTAATGYPEIVTLRNNNDVREIKIYIPNLKYPFSGFYSTQSDFNKVFERAVEEKTMLTMLFEQKRKKDIPVDIPIADLRKTPELAKEKTTKTVLAIYSYKMGKWVMSPEATLTAEDIPEDWTKTIIAMSQKEDFELDSFDEPKQMPRVYTQDIYENNLLLINFYMFVKDQEIKYEYELPEERRKLIAQRMLSFANLIQQQITGANFNNIKDYSHTKARGLVFQVIERFYPLDSSALTDDGLNNIFKNAVVKALELLKWE